MRNLAISGVAVLFFAVAAVVPTARAQNNLPTYRTEVSASRVWSNDDLDELRSRGLISTFNPSPSLLAQDATAPAAPQAEVVLPRTPRPLRAEDPEWYAEQAARLQAEMDAGEDALQQYLRNLQDAKEPDHTTGGIDLAKGNAGITPEAGLQVLQARIDEVAAALDHLAEMARENGIPPGVLRS